MIDSRVFNLANDYVDKRYIFSRGKKKLDNRPDVRNYAVDIEKDIDRQEFAPLMATRC